MFHSLTIFYRDARCLIISLSLFIIECLLFARYIPLAGIQNNILDLNSNESTLPRVIVPLMPYRNPINSDYLQFLRAITFDRLPICADGRYSRYAGFFLQRLWVGEQFSKQWENNDTPIIYYDQSEIWPKPSTAQCRFKCNFSNAPADISRASMVVFKKSPDMNVLPVNEKIIFMMTNVESPRNLPYFGDSVKHRFEIFQTYMLNSTIPIPYGSFMAFKDPHCLIPDEVRQQISQIDNKHLLPEYHYKRTRLVAWVVRNTNPSNQREEYYQELSRYIEIDRYGPSYNSCGDGVNEDGCFNKISRTHKFYLAFENSNCVEYITEKFFRNALSNDMVPIVYGGTREDYYETAPPNSFIHVDDFKSMKEMADYLLWLQSNNTAYASYFAWKEYGKIAEDATSACRACGILHLKLNGSLPSMKVDFASFGDPKILCRS